MSKNDDSAWAPTKTGERLRTVPDRRPPHLVVVYSPNREIVGRRWPLNGEPLIFGRARTLSARISDERMSKQHAIVEVGRDGFRVRDLGSRNGTFVDGQRVDDKPALLGQVIAMGSSLIVFDPTHPDAGNYDDEDRGEPRMVSASETMRGVRQQLLRAAKAKGGILLLGPTGVGKEVAAQFIARHSPRRGPFRAANCAAFQPSVADSELFGHVKGAFTGADRTSDGLFVAADRGILFLDELRELDQSVQAKLLRVAENGEVRKVGGTTLTTVDVRLITATNQAVNTDGFRSDLFARLCTWVIEIPALKERRADILPLFEHFYEAEVGVKPSMSLDFAEALLLDSWPLNARGLRNLARRVAGDPTIALTVHDLPGDIQAHLEKQRRPDDSSPSSAALLPDKRRQQLHDALTEAHGNVSAAATQLGMDRTKLYREAQKFGIDVKNYRRSESTE